MKVRTGFVEVEGHRLAYLAVNEHLASAEQPALVFIHGVLVSINFWRGTLPANIRDNRAWYALSLPAHHPSTVPADFSSEHVDADWFFRLMNGALEQLLDGQKAIVVGHSTGGFCALNLAINQAPSVLGIVSIAGFHSGNWSGVEGMLVKLASLGRWAKPLFAMNLQIARRIPLVQRVFASLLACKPRTYLASPLSQRMLDNCGADMQQQDSTALFNLFNGISRLEIAERLHAITMPCHIFSGSHDPVVPTTQTLRIVGEVPRARPVEFNNVGHMPFMEDTTAFFSALERAINEIANLPAVAAMQTESNQRNSSDELSPVSSRLATHS